MTTGKITLAIVVAVLWSAAAWAKCFDNPGAAPFIDATRARIEAACPCATSPSRAAYVLCAKAEVRAAVLDGALPRQCRSMVSKGITRSTCGRPTYVTCCRPGPVPSRRCKATLPAACGTLFGTVGATASCYDACGSVCGNAVVEGGEQCDDRNTLDADGCSATCQDEPPPGCVSITAEEYEAAFGASEFFRRTLIRAQNLGYQPTLLHPVRCPTTGGGQRYLALLARTIGAPTDVLVLESDTTMPEDLSTTATSFKLGEPVVEHFAYASLTYDVLPSSAVAMGVLGTDGQPWNPFPAATATLSCAAAVKDCIKERFTDPSVECLACTAAKVGCRGKIGPVLLACKKAAAEVCKDCKSNIRDCLRRRGWPCKDMLCRTGQCGWADHLPSPAPGTSAVLPPVADLVCHADEPTAPSPCPPCAPCEQGECLDDCPGCTACRNGACETLSPGSFGNTPVMAYVSTDAGLNLPLSCWADAGPPCGYTCDGSGICTAITSCGITWGNSVQYLLCSGGGALPWGFCSGSSGVYFTDTCGLMCGQPDTLCDATLHREIAWSQFPACEDSRGWGVHIPPGTHEVGERFWFTPESKVRQCCPFFTTF